MRLILLCSFILVLTCCAPVLASTESDKLARVDALRLDNHQQAQKILSSIDARQLSDEEQELYRYLQVLLTTFDGDLLNTYQQYEKLVKSAKTPAVRIRALTSQVSVTSFVGKWAEGFELANKLQNLLTPSLPIALRKNALHGLITFYSNAKQPQIASSLIAQLEKLVDDNPTERCVLMSKKLKLLFSEQATNLSLNFILDIKSLCERADNEFYSLYADTYLFYYMVKKENTDQALMLLEPLKKKVENRDFVFMTTGLYAYIADLYYQLDRLDASQEAAVKVLSMDESGDFLPSKIQALKRLIEIAVQRKDYRRAFDRLTELEDARSRFREMNVVKQTAYQQVNFELALKQSQIDLLDKRNTLLETQSELSKARVKSSLIALGLISILLMGVLAWIYRSRKLQDKLRELARIDSLTGTFNRGYFLQRVKKQLMKAESKSVTCSLLLLDLDHFKRVNDTYGHQAGDWVLTEVVRSLNIVCDEHCTLGRMGGEEFAIFIYHADISQGLALAEQCRAAIDGIDTAQSGYRFPLSASFGVSDTTQVGYRFENLSSASDLALYQSKQYGRNRVYKYDSNVER